MAEGTPGPSHKGFWITALAAFVGVIGGQILVSTARGMYAAWSKPKGTT